MEYIHSLKRNKILTNNLTTQMNFFNTDEFFGM